MKYTNEQILNKVRSLQDYRRTVGIPLLVGIQSRLDEFDKFDDKFYLFDDKDRFVSVATGTTNAGATGMKDFMKFGLNGVAVWECDHFYPKFYRYGKHKEKMIALRQNEPCYLYRDNNRNEKNEYIGKRFFLNIGANFHGIDYDPNSTKVIERIGGWSIACQVCNNMNEYRAILKFVKPFEFVDYCILKEF